MKEIGIDECVHFTIVNMYQRWSCSIFLFVRGVNRMYMRS